MNVVPPGWRNVRLAEVAQQCLGKMLDAKKNKGRPLPYLRNPNVRWFDVDTSDLREMPFEDHELDRYGLRAGDVLVCEGGEAGRAAIWDGRLPQVKFQKAIHRVRTGPELHNRYLVYRLLADYQSGRLADYYTGATIKHLTGQDLARYELPLPPLDEQRRIAEVLDRAEALRAKRRAALAQLDTLTQSIFLDLARGCGTGTGEWARQRLLDLCSAPDDIRCGPFGTQLAKSEFRDTGVPLWGIRNVNTFFERLTHEFLDRETAQRLSQYSIEPGDIVMTRKGTVGNCAVYPSHLPPGVMHSDLLRIRVSQTRCLPVFLAHQLHHSADVERQISLISGGAIMPGINVSRLKTLEVLVPPLAVQQDFVRRTNAVAALRATERRSLAELDALFASLQHRAFRGEL